MIRGGLRRSGTDYTKFLMGKKVGWSELTLLHRYECINIGVLEMETRQGIHSWFLKRILGSLPMRIAYNGHHLGYSL